MSSGKYKPHRGFNKVQIRNGMVVRLNKNNTVYDKTKPLVIPKGQPYKKGTKYKATKAGR